MFKCGKVYKIISDQCNHVYIGSTIYSLEDRMKSHLSHFKRCKKGLIKSNIRVNEILDMEGDIKIILLEECVYNKKIQLHNRERYWIDKTDNCINKQLPGRTREEYLIDTEYYKKYYQKNKEYYQKKYLESKKKTIKA